MDDKSFTIRVPKRFARIGLIVGVVALIVAPLTAVAAHVFNDVPDSHTFHNDIAWLADAGVTKGCNPPSNTEFCPDDNVTRGQMGAFMRRFAQYIGAEDGTPVEAENADQLDGKDGPAYETVVAAASCGLTFAGGLFETTCIPSSGGNIGTESNAEVLEVTIDVPAAGALQISSSGISENIGNSSAVLFQATIGSSCPSDVVAAVNGGLNNQIWANDPGVSTAAHLTTSVSAGTHTVRLCGLNASTADPAQVLASTLNVQWTAGGSVEVESSSPSPVDTPAIIDN